MPIFLITGSAGTGKSEVCRALKERDYEAFDIDDDGLARWQHNETGNIHPKSSVSAEQRTADFIKEHSWNVPTDYLAGLASSSGGRPIFICGSLGNEDKVRNLFKIIFALYVDEDTLVHRLASRSNNDWGKQPHELEQTLIAHRNSIKKYNKLGYITIDADQPIKEVVKAILKKVKARVI